MEISEVAGYKDGQIHLNTLFKFEESGTGEDLKVEGLLKSTGSRLINKEKLKMAGIFADI